MAYAQSGNSYHKVATIGAVAALHVAVGYVLVTGLAASGVLPDVAAIFEARNIAYEPPPPPPAIPEEQPAIQPDKAAVEPRQSVITAPIQFDTTPATLPDIQSMLPKPPESRVMPPPADQPRFTPEPVKPRNDPGGWVCEADYSSQAIRLGREGIARFSLTIGADGRVSDCQITVSSGHPELDRATCDLVSKRARFEPARNDKGDKVSGTYSNAVRWKITN